MKRIMLLTVISLGTLALMGCGSTAEKANTGATQNTEAAKTVLKPGDVSPDKAVKIDDLVAGAIADKDAWKGKEVAVTGFVSATSGSIITLMHEANSKSKKYTSCVTKGELPQGLVTKTIEVKGKISSVDTGDYNTVRLDPCELKK